MDLKRLPVEIVEVPRVVDHNKNRLYNQVAPKVEGLAGTFSIEKVLVWMQVKDDIELHQTCHSSMKQRL